VRGCQAFSFRDLGAASVVDHLCILYDKVPPRYVVGDQLAAV